MKKTSKRAGSFQQGTLRDSMPDRRHFIRKASLGAGGLLFLPSRSLFAANGQNILWTRKDGRFTGVACAGRPMHDGPEWVRASCRPVGGDGGANPLAVSVRQLLRDSGAGEGEDVLEIVLTVRNPLPTPLRAQVEFSVSARPWTRIENQRAYVPLTAAGLSGDPRFAALGVNTFLKDCDHPVGAGEFTAHYLEPMASHAEDRTTRALLLAPVVDVFEPGQAWRVAMFMESHQPARFRHTTGVWNAGRELTVGPGAEEVLRFWLMVHAGDASTPWRAFHRFAHREDYQVPEWVHGFRVHYFDFLSSAKGQGARRGDGYDADAAHFREFSVGLGTQHGYYPAIGDYLHPDRKEWQAMRGDKAGPAAMSINTLRARIRATRAAGARAGVYLHPVLFDDASPIFEKLRDCVQVDAAGKPMRFSWQGPDTAGCNWRASLAAPAWREHLLQQAQWIMEVLKPDAIVMDETFAGLGIDYHPDRAGPCGPAAIGFYRALRKLVRSFGDDKAFFTSDCSMSPFVLWADGECGDHAYSTLLGHPLYAREPARYLAALGGKPWRPCAWHFTQMWDAQMRLARQVGAGIGVSNGWLEYSGLGGIPAVTREKILQDIASLTPATSRCIPQDPKRGE